MILGAHTKLVEVEGSTIRDLIETLNLISGGTLKKEILAENGDLDPRFKIYVNGALCDGPGLNMHISDGDNVMLFPVIDGG